MRRNPGCPRCLRRIRQPGKLPAKGKAQANRGDAHSAGYAVLRYARSARDVIDYDYEHEHEHE